MKTYIINLKESQERRKRVLEEVSKYPFMDVEFVEAVNGRKLTRQETSERFDVATFECRYQRMPQPGEIGCTLSQRICFQKLLDSTEEVALILEDDAFFVSPDAVESVITESARLIASKEAGMVLFTPEHIYYRKGQHLIGEYTLYKVFQGYGTWAYVVNRKAAERILRIKRPSILADDHRFLRVKGINMRFVFPSITIGLSNTGLVAGEIEAGRMLPNTSEFKGWMKVRAAYYWLCYLCHQKERGLRFKLGQLAKSYNDLTPLNNKKDEYI